MNSAGERLEQRRLAWLASAARGRTALEIGAAGGALTQLLVQRGMSVVATEPDPAHLEQLETNDWSNSENVTVVADWLPDNTGDEFDTIVIVDAGGRLPDLFHLVGQVQPLLGPDGRLLTSIGIIVDGVTPNYGDLDTSISLELLEQELLEEPRGRSATWLGVWRRSDTEHQVTGPLLSAMRRALAGAAGAAEELRQDLPRLRSHIANLERRRDVLERSLQLTERARSESHEELMRISESHRTLSSTHAELQAKARKLQETVDCIRSELDRARTERHRAETLKEVALDDLRRSREAPARDATVAPIPSPTPSVSGRVGLGLRVGFVGSVGVGWFSSWVRPVVVRPSWVGSLVESAGGHLDVLVVDSDPAGFGVDQVLDLVEEAAEAGVKTVGLAPVGAGLPVWSGQVDVVVSDDLAVRDDGAMVVFPRPVDPYEVNPIGWRRETADRFVVPVGSWVAPDAWHRALEAVTGSVGPGRVDLLDVGGAADRDVPEQMERIPASPKIAEQVTVMRDRLGVLDHPDLHENPGAHAARLVAWCAAGVPVVSLGLPGEVAGLLGSRLAKAIRSARVDELSDLDLRERVSVGQRRAALTGHGSQARWRQLADVLDIPVPAPWSISVVVATNRPDFLDHMIAQINRQTYQPRETVIALHGDGFPQGTDERLRRDIDGAVTCLQVPERRVLGEVLNAAVEAATGDLITKIDDDDWYGPEHLTDLVLATDYSGADLVAKGAEFVYLADLDITIRRFTTGAETPNRTMAGGTLTLRRDWLRQLGGWPRVPRAVDQTLIDDVLSADGTIHRTHGFGYILHRHGRHTWDAEADYFLLQSDRQNRGLALQLAAIDVTVERGRSTHPDVREL